MRGKIVVVGLLAIAVGGIVAVRLWLRRPGGGETRDEGAAHHQLVAVGEALQRYWVRHQEFPERLDQLCQENDPMTREPFLLPAMIENPWGRPLEVERKDADHVLVRSRTPERVLVIKVEKAARLSVEEER